MGEVINANAGVARIEDNVRRTLRIAIARGDDIAKAAENRLAPVVAGIDAALAVQKTASEAEATASAVVLAESAKGDDGIGALRDVMWNMLGRPRQSAYMDQVFPGGIGLYTGADPRQKPVLMQVLQSRIQSVGASRWTEAMRADWTAQLEALRVPYDAAVAALRPLEAAAMVADVGYRTAVHTAHGGLRAFKRDLQTLGLSDSQIHEIIPDASVANGGASGGKKPSGPGATPGAGAPAPGGTAGGNTPNGVASPA
jgi:hypothetical protein